VLERVEHRTDATPGARSKAARSASAATLCPEPDPAVRIRTGPVPGNGAAVEDAAATGPVPADDGGRAAGRSAVADLPREPLPGVAPLTSGRASCPRPDRRVGGSPPQDSRDEDRVEQQREAALDAIVLPWGHTHEYRRPPGRRQRRDRRRGRP
jgi:hypothetical protein